MPLEAVFGLASMTKIMASVAALQLNEQGRLPLRSLLADYSPRFAIMKVGVVQPDDGLKN
jgi:CubicO group peptidase (beta-lactamase class C family)